MQIEHLSLGLREVKLATDSAQGTFSGYGAVFNNTDAHGDAIAKGAFKKTLREWEDERGKFPPMLLQHGGGLFGGSPEGMLPIGKWTSMEENSRGLKVEGELLELETDLSKRVLANLRKGTLDGLSIGFRTRQSVTGTKPNEPRRTLTDIDLVEVSLVTFPANPKARVTAVKSMTAEQLRDLEASLRDAGLSRKDAVIASSAFKAWLQRDAGVPTILPRDEDRPAATVTLADVLRTARKVRADSLASR